MGKRSIKPTRPALGGWGGVYDPRLAFAFCLILSAALWWVPIFGAATAGYVCGRKSGSMTFGAISALLAGGVLLLAVHALDVFAGHPSYIDPFYSDGLLDLSNLGLVTAFGFVGGVLSRQSRQEKADLLEAGSTSLAVRPPARSIDLHRRGRDIGFESFDDCMESMGMTVNKGPAAPARQAEPRRQEAAGLPDYASAPPNAPAHQYTPTRSEAEGNPFSDIIHRSGKKTQ